MKIIHSFLPTNYQQDIENYLNVSEMSVNSIRNHYDEITLYTTPSIAEEVRRRGIRYTEISTEIYTNFSHESYNNYAIPKILCYLHQTKPFIHIDYDVVIFSKINTQKDFTIGYYDFNFKEQEVKHTDITRLDEYYINDLKNIHPTLPENIQKLIDLRLLPNFCIFGTTNINLCKTVFNSILSFYDTQKDLFSKLEHSPSMLEQFLFMPYLRYHLYNQEPIENILGTVENRHINPREFVENQHQYAKFLHLTQEKSDSSFLETLKKYLIQNQI